MATVLDNNPVNVTPQDTESSSPEAFYRQRASLHRVDVARETALWNRVANFRLIIFVLGVVALGYGLFNNVPLLQGVGIGAAFALILMVRYHRVLGKRKRRYEELLQINLEAGTRVTRHWSELPLRHTVRPQPGDPYSHDLDIFGHASLFQLLDNVTTHAGETTLAAWLRHFASPEAVIERQSAVSELAGMVDFRDELELRGRLAGTTRTDPERFLQWAESEPWLPRHPWVRPAAIMGAAAFWLGAAAQVAGLTTLPLWTFFGLINLLFTFTTGRKVYSLIEQATLGEAGLRHYASAFELLCAPEFKSPLLQRIQRSLTGGDVTASSHIHRLYRLTTFLIPPSAVLYTVIQGATLWDVHLLAALERWQQRAGKHARSWLVSLGEVEALSSLARISHDNPGWAFPVVDTSASSLKGEELGHPMLPAAQRVSNSVTVGPPGTFLLVTGSNMSGKSTLLRSIGVNIVLAGAGAPVCARSLLMPPVDLWTSMRVEDSLERGVSYYMAELQRLKSVVDAAKNSRQRADVRVFYLLDEILQGTNTHERQVAARRVIMYLVGRGALGAVSTHDLNLADAPKVASAARPVHFTETLSNNHNGPAMTFSYKLHSGIATSTNALRLMQIVGLDLEDDPEEAIAP